MNKNNLVRGRRLLEVLTLKEIQVLIGIISNPVHRIAISLMALAGLRISEAKNIELKNIFMSKGYLQIFGKGDKERKVPISVPLKKELQNYLSKFSKNSGPLITISIRSIQKALSFYSKKVFAKHINAHLLRHSFATILYANGVPLEKIAAILGHERILTTAIYTHTTVEVSKSAIAVMNPKKGFKEKLKSIVTEDAYTDYGLRFKENKLIRGRDMELSLLHEYIKKSISVIIYGDPGIGKTYLAEQIENSFMITEFKKKDTLIEIILDSHNKKQTDEDYQDILKTLKKMTISEIIDIIKDSKVKKIIIFDDIGKYTKQEKQLIKKLSEIIPIIATATNKKEEILRLFTTHIELKPLPKDVVRQIIYEMIFIPNLEEKNKFVNTILAKAGKNLKDAVYFIQQADLGKKIENMTSGSLNQRTFSVGPFIALAFMAYIALIIKNTTVSIVTFSIVVFWIIRLLFMEFVWKPSMQRRKQQ